jgi:hypothetical protein
MSEGKRLGRVGQRLMRDLTERMRVEKDEGGRMKDERGN